MEFNHQQSAHCESGVVSSMLTHAGLPISEPMAFGLAGALAFAYVPFIKLSGMPLIAYRMPPKTIIKGLKKALDLDIRFRKFHKPESARLALDAALAQEKLVGLQTSVYWLPYFPEDMRFHFNAHNLLVYGKGTDGSYLISDPVFEHPVTATAESLEKARFAKGPLAPKGMMYYLNEAPDEIDFQRAIPRAIKRNLRSMTGAPLPLVGLRGMRYLADKIDQLAVKSDPRYLRMFLHHLVRMQEEIGTGGAGFRFIYASFLQESAALIDRPQLAEASAMMTDTGDAFREFALKASIFSKEKHKASEIGAVTDSLRNCALKEQAAWSYLKVNL